MPGLISASMLLRRGDLRRRDDADVPLSSSAERRRLRLKLPPTEPSDRPSAPPCPVPTAAGRLTAKSDGVADDAAGGRLVVGGAAGDADAAREDEPGRVAARGAGVHVAAPLDAELARVRGARLDDARLDQDLRGLGVEAGEEVDDAAAVGGQVVDDERVRARLDLDAALGARAVARAGRGRCSALT